MFWFVIAAIGVIVLCVLFPFLRGVLLHPFKVLFYAPKDIFNYFRHKDYNKPDFGFINVYAGLFGQGKTLSATRYLIGLYNRYNGKKWYIEEYGEFRKIKINIVSNVELKGVPYTPFTSMQQIVDWQKYAQEHREEFCYFLCDEASSVLNSRNFRENLNYFTINSFLTCRKSHCGLLLTSQRFNEIDKLCREVCQKVIQCRKVWRVLIHDIYDAYELENVTNPLNVKPRACRVAFVSDRSFNAYNTNALVDQIEKDCKDGKMRTDEEILRALCPRDIDVSSETKKGLFKRK